MALMLVTEGSSKNVSRRSRDGDERVEQECVSRRPHFGDKSMLVTKGLGNNMSLATPNVDGERAQQECVSRCLHVSDKSSKNVFLVAPSDKPTFELCSHFV